MKNPFSVVKDFEDAVAEYTGAPYCVAVNSCTNALFLCLMWVKLLHFSKHIHMTQYDKLSSKMDFNITIPKYTYVGVAQQIKLAGFKINFEDKEWSGEYQLKPTNVWDSARRFLSNMYHQEQDQYICTSHHWSKILGIQQGGCILHENEKANEWFRKARFDGRTEGKNPKLDQVQIGWHMYMSPEIAAEGLVRLHHLPKFNEDLPNSNYSDLSQMKIFN